MLSLLPPPKPSKAVPCCLDLTMLEFPPPYKAALPEKKGVENDPWTHGQQVHRTNVLAPLPAFSPPPLFTAKKPGRFGRQTSSRGGKQSFSSMRALGVSSLPSHHHHPVHTASTQADSPHHHGARLLRNEDVSSKQGASWGSSIDAPLNASPSPPPEYRRRHSHTPHTHTRST